MKKIRNYIFSIVMMMIAFFVVIEKDIKAAEADVVINPDSNNKPLNVHKVYILDEENSTEEETVYKEETKQFTSARDIRFKIILDDDNELLYEDNFTVCEIVPPGGLGNNSVNAKLCSEYSLEDGVHYLQISGREDGEKEIVVRLNYWAKGAGGQYTVQGSEEISKKIVLDTTGPIIDLTGGEYIYLPKGQKYVEQKATCVDNSALTNKEYACTVEVEEANIDMTKSGFQYVMYKAEDFLGNDTTIRRKVMVEVDIDDKGIDMYWYFAIGLVIVVRLALTYIVIKNKEKQKNQSVL